MLVAAALTMGMGAQAQSWVPSEVGAGTYYLYNVGAGKFLTSGNWWGTHAAVDDDGMAIEFIAAEGGYKLSTAVAFSGKYVNTAWMDQSTQAVWSFTKVGDTNNYTMKSGDDYMVWTSDAVADLSKETPTTNAGYWQLVTKDQLIANLDNATEQNPIDASFYMTNPKIRRNWPVTFSGEGFSDKGSFNADMAGLYDGGCGSVGQYHKTFDNYQELKGVKNGKYRVSVKGFYRQAEGYNPAYLYANNVEQVLKVKGDIGGDNATQATKALVGDTYLVDAVTVTVSDGTLRVGVKGNNVDWATWREFTIQYLGVDYQAILDAAKANLAAEIKTAEGLKTDSRTEGTAELNAAISAAETALKNATTPDDVDDVNAALETLKAAEQAFLEANSPLQPGVYYVYNALADKFLSRGNAYGTAAVVDDYGLAVKVAYTISGDDYLYTLTGVDNNACYGFDAWMYADAGGVDVRSYTIKKVETGYTLTNTKNSQLVYVYMKDDADKYRVAGNAIKDDNYTDDAQTVWQFLTAEEREVIVDKHIDDMNVAAAEAAGIDMEVELEEKESYELTFKTGNKWQYTPVRNDKNTNLVTNDNGTEVFQGTGTFTQTLENLKSGLYLVGIPAFYRDGSNENVSALFDQGYNLSTAYLEANGTKVQVKSWGEDRASNTNPNIMAEAHALFEQGKYLSTGLAYVGEDGKMTLTVAVPSFIWGGWFIADNVTVSYLKEPLATDLAEGLALLNEEIEHAIDVLADAKEATREAEDKLLDAIDEADALYKKGLDGGATLDEVIAMIEKLQAAEKEFLDTTGATTAISTISNGTEARQAYTLGGQQVRGQLSKGVYVVNGKKVVVK